MPTKMSVPISRKMFLEKRLELLKDNGKTILAAEEKYMRLFLKLILDHAETLRKDFDASSELYPFWANYPPEQRGRQPVGDSVPWIEVGETSLTANITRLIATSEDFGEITFPGLPSGGDMRFATEDAFIHFDIKVTGPRDATDEVVASRNQISGHGVDWDVKGLVNSVVKIYGKRSTHPFKPELPPFYILNGKVLICLTYFAHSFLLRNGTLLDGKSRNGQRFTITCPFDTRPKRAESVRIDFHLRDQLLGNAPSSAPLYDKLYSQVSHTCQVALCRYSFAPL